MMPEPNCDGALVAGFLIGACAGLILGLVLASVVFVR